MLARILFSSPIVIKFNIFIHWIFRKFSVSEEDELIRDFEFENDTYIDPVKQITKENREKEWDREM